ncbi:HAMP domain-containing histidine kinase [Microvirga massiliensis]|uniref:HAMP domain-containing histidine kinase n=1 Tax=Microvirga massiliensis TaxID=1033741 RepID=UPI00062B6C9A|nr:HAMP domain-containing histidine kinase [Microvirga massiliensis]
MRPSRSFLSLRSSLPAKLALVAALFVLAVIALRSLTLDRLAHIDAVSGEVRNRWLDSVQILGSLSHHVAVSRIQEAEILFNRDRSGSWSRSDDLQQSLDEAEQDIERYRSVLHDSDEAKAFDDFSKDWTEYNKQAQALMSLAQGERWDEAMAQFKGPARSSFLQARAALRRLTDLTESKADAARQTAADAIVRAQRFVSDLTFSVLFLFTALILYVWGSFSRPLLALAGRMQRLAAHDADFSVPFTGRRDEIGDVARALVVFRRHTVELLESRKSLATQAEMLAGSLDKERALAAEQRNFIRTMSHELRTPLTSIDGQAQRLIATKDRASPDQIANRAHKIRAAVFRLTSLVVSLTGAIEMAHESIEPRRRRFDLARMLHDLRHYYSEIGMGDTLEEKIGDLPEEITGDPMLLYYAFSNLVSNAFKYSPDDGTVTLTARAEDDFVEVVVEDRGVGIPAGEIDRVLERFYRGSNVGSIPGTGVGLHLVDQIVRRHGGSLRIDSEVGRGTRITVSLPIVSADGVSSEDALEQDPVCRGRRGDSEPSDGGSERIRLHG